MARYAYVAKDAGGSRVEGELEVRNPSEAALRLRQAGVVPLTISPVRGGGSGAKAKSDTAAEAAPQANRKPARRGPAGAEEPWAERLRGLLKGGDIRFGPKKVGAIELQGFTRELHALIKAGIPVMRALDLLRESTASPALAELLGGIRVQLDAGMDLPDAFERENERARVFSPYYLAILRVGSFTGRLDECLLRLSQYLEFQRTMREQVASALRYPSFVILAAVVAMVVINLFVLPQFERIFAGMKADLPLLTRVLLGTSKAVVNYWMAVAIAVAAGIWALRRWMETPSGQDRRDGFLLKAPVIGDMVTKTCLARFAQALALAMRSGVPLVQGLEIVALTVDNRRFERAIVEMRERVSRGDSIRVAAAGTGMFPKQMLQVIAVGEETGALDGLLEELGEFYRTEVEYATSRLSSRLEPMLISGLGAIVLVLALGVFLPMWELGRAAMGRG